MDVNAFVDVLLAYIAGFAVVSIGIWLVAYLVRGALTEGEGHDASDD